MSIDQSTYSQRPKSNEPRSWKRKSHLVKTSISTHRESNHFGGAAIFFSNYFPITILVLNHNPWGFYITACIYRLIIAISQLNKFENCQQGSLSVRINDCTTRTKRDTQRERERTFHIIYILVGGRIWRGYFIFTQSYPFILPWGPGCVWMSVRLCGCVYFRQICNLGGLEFFKL